MPKSTGVRSRAFGTLLVHDYLGLSVERIWHIVASDLPVLK
jgi:uncharacterized protein with HEPN domain